MNRYQKKILTNVITVVTATTIFVALMVSFRQKLNMSEASRAMTELGKFVLDYKKQNGSLPGQSVIDSIRDRLMGSGRMGEIQYRAQWITIDSPPTTILAYDTTVYKWLFNKKVLVLLLDGRVVSMDPQEFQTTLQSQQSSAEISEIEKTQRARGAL